MKLIIQIPCYNEEKTLPDVLAELPKAIKGIDKIETLVINDGSDDKTVAVAKECGVDHIVDLKTNFGLAYAFSAGIEASLKLGADLIVNTDGDNQYNGADIEILVRPILKDEADLVIGAREIENIDHFSFLKKRLQRWGSRVVSRAAGVKIPDVTSGFRAFSREAALNLNIMSGYTYTLESIIQAGRKGIRIKSVPVSTNEKLRESRLIKSMYSYVRISMFTILRVLMFYRPLGFFALMGALLFLAGLIPGIRFLWFWFTGHGSGHIQSLILATILIILGFQTLVLGLLADLIGNNRRLIEDLLYRIKKKEDSGS